MVTRVLVKKATYRDSISLMKLSTGISKLPGVTQAAVVMATELNRRVLSQAGFKDPAIDQAGGDDMIIAIEALDEKSLDTAFAETNRQLTSSSERTSEAEASPRSLDEALQRMPDANLVVISVPGQFAKREAMFALQKRLNVFLFSSNVSRENELELKKLSSQEGLLLMGPDCGTSIINHKVLGFGNVVRRGGIGLVSASGTGLQEVSTLIHKAGLGISQAIGTGGGDLSELVGGIAMLQGIRLLESDDETKLIILISKPPSPKTMSRVLEAVGQCSKPVVVNFLGADPAQGSGLVAARTLEDAARAACSLYTGSDAKVPTTATPDAVRQALQDHQKLSSSQRFLRGLFSGGTLCYESQVILNPVLEKVLSNGPIREEDRISGQDASTGHCCIDMGAEEFVEGRAHPMVDFSLRKLRILQEARDPSTAVILLDVVLGVGSNPDPAGELVPAIRRAREIGSESGRYIPVVASVVGTDQDPQNLAGQLEALNQAGVTVLPSNAQATWVAAMIAVGKEIPLPVRKPVSPPAPEGRRKTVKVPLGLIGSPLRAVNLGIPTFADDLQAQGVEVLRVDWRPPAGGDPRMLDILERLGS